MDKKTPRGRRLALLALVVLLGLGAGHALLWRMMSGRLLAGWTAWVEQRRAQGWRVEHGPPLPGGWPLAATLEIPALRLEGAATTLPGGLGWRADRAVLRVELPRLDRLRVEMLGQQRLRLGATEIPYAADSLVALVPLEGDAPPREAVVEAAHLRLGLPGGAHEVLSARLFLQASSTATEAEPALALSLEALGLDLPGAPPAPGFGRRVEQLAAELALTGPVPGGRSPTGRAEAWRDGGGTLELRALTLRWGPVAAAAAATLALDEALQPMGAGTLRLTGAAEAVEALAAAGVIGRRAAATARSVLPLLTRAPANGGAPVLEVPVTLEDRTLAIGRIPVARFGTLDWPAAR